MEIEKRYQLTDDQFNKVSKMFEWGAAKRVCDLTLGPSGPTSMQTDGWVVRLRMTPSGASMDYKAPTNPEWTAWKEFSTEIGNFGETIRILEAIGLKHGLLLDRTRRTAHHENLELSLDDLSGLGKFLEIEGKGGEEEKEDIFSRIHLLSNELGIDSTQEARPYGELLLGRLETEPEFRSEHERLVQDILEASV